ncbi:hypothetical protein [Gemmobacter serpentinus]|uniref:hypothetical protein n=1 Tax=Gemmobacter serpentinus TaxID=2652247 RepID=UPI00124F7508|nr:hypothetical protein [Gemmobacter serpentinus]
MKMQRRLALAVSLVAIGLGAGHLVQSRAAKPVASAPGTDQAALSDEALARPRNVEQLAAGADDLAPAPGLPLAGLSGPVGSGGTLGAAPATGLPDASAAADCPITLDLLADTNAMIGVTLIAPCRPDQRVMVKHAGLSVTAKTSATGTMFLNLPALEADARIELSFGDGEKIASRVEMPEVKAMQRFAVQWLDQDQFQLQAFENGADYGQAGHVSAAAPHSPAPGLPAKGGFLTLLGDATVDLPMLGEVYTFPANGAAEVVLEAAITPETCGRELMGETISATGGKVSVSELTLAMPECDAAGDILVLKNLVPEMKLAAR